MRAGDSGVKTVPPESRTARAIYVGCVTLFLTSLGCWALLAHSDGPVAKRLKAQQNGLTGDERFARTVVQQGIAEVRLGELAQSRAGNEAVRSFGERMIVQHTTVTDQLRDAAAKDNISLPAEMSAKDRESYNKLAKLDGAEFDRAYAQSMVENHERDLALFQSEAETGKSENIRDCAARTTPVVRAQLNEARQILKGVSPR